MHRAAAVPLRAHPDDAHQLLLHRRAGLCVGPGAQQCSCEGRVFDERTQACTAGVDCGHFGCGTRYLCGARVWLWPAHTVYDVPAYVVRGERQPDLAHLTASHALTCGALCVCSRRHPGGRYRIPGAALYCQPVDGPDGYLGCHRDLYLLGVL